MCRSIYRIDVLWNHKQIEKATAMNTLGSLGKQYFTFSYIKRFEPIIPPRTAMGQKYIFIRLGKAPIQQERCTVFMVSGCILVKITSVHFKQYTIFLKTFIKKDTNNYMKIMALYMFFFSDENKLLASAQYIVTYTYKQWTYICRIYISNLYVWKYVYTCLCFKPLDTHHSNSF